MRLRLVAVVLIAVIAAAPLFAAQQVVQGKEVEDFLRRARFTARQDLGTGVTRSLKVTLQLDGKTQSAVLKTIDQKRPGPVRNAAGELERDFQDSWRTEVAAYELDKLLELGMVPATIERRSPYDDVPASLQLWVEAAMSEAARRKNGVVPPNGIAWSEQLSNMYLFDALIYNTDRHPDNLLITADFQVRLIDHSRSFRPNEELRNALELTRFSRKLVTKIEQLNSNMLGKALGNYLTLTQLEAIMKRRQLILDRVREQVKQFGEAVFF
jgi:hypothetical protein